MSDVLNVPHVLPTKRRRQAAKPRSGTAAVSTMMPIKQVNEIDCSLGRVTGAAQELCWTVGGGAGASIVGGSRMTELFLAPVSIAASASSDAGRQVMVLSDGTAITSMDVARFIAS